MENILTLNAISNKIDNVFGIDYTVSDTSSNPVGILVRSFDMHDYDLPSSVLAVSRAGAGVNNIPVEEYAEKGVVVFNTPGANANAVCELVITALLMGSRKIVKAIDWVKSIKDDENLSKTVEKGKKEFVGQEIFGKKLGVIGLGAIGAKVANTAISLGMEVLGYDPYLSVINALHISRHVEIT
ncbi:MAG: 3-phosphoglycerate dehydrogenase, partial [Clostridia bacterium]|nr:3-phosphoglycerate dehydrogenase [Clostridia bacterium]